MDYGAWSMDRGLWTMDYGLWTMDYGLWTMDYGLWTMDYGLWTMDYGLWAMGYVLFPTHPSPPHPLRPRPPQAWAKQAEPKADKAGLAWPLFHDIWHTPATPFPTSTTPAAQARTQPVGKNQQIPIFDSFDQKKGATSWTDHANNHICYHDRRGLGEAIDFQAIQF